PDVPVEVNLHRRLGPAEWSAFARPGRRLKEGDVIRFAGGLEAHIASKTDSGEVSLAFNLEGAALDDAITRIGAMPLPPYIVSKRPADAEDFSDYQTTFARDGESVAAPTAGLHVTPALRQRLAARGVGWETVRLDVNAGTFLPVKADRVE